MNWPTALLTIGGWLAAGLTVALATYLQQRRAAEGLHRERVWQALSDLLTAAETLSTLHTGADISTVHRFSSEMLSAEARLAALAPEIAEAAHAYSRASTASVEAWTPENFRATYSTRMALTEAASPLVRPKHRKPLVQADG